MRYRISSYRAAAILCSCFAGFPATSQEQAGGTTIACGNPYVIGKGDTLSSLAAKVYGDPKRYEILFEANRDAIGDDPANVALGTSIMVPCLDASGKPITDEAAVQAEAAMQAAISAEGLLDPAALDTLFGPVALFPDPLLTQVLMAATFPLDVVKADRFIKELAALTDKQRVDGAENAPWDPSVRQLTAGFPDLVTRMADHIDWTEQAGDAVIAQTEDVLDAIQRLRAKAQDNGYLGDNDAQSVEVVDNVIYIEPADPEVIYVPTYDSQVIYTTPVTGSPFYDPFYYGYDGNDWADALAAGAIIFGGALVLDEIFDDNDHWGDNWHDGGSIDWDTGDINIDRGDINIGNGNINIGDGNRPPLGSGSRPGLGEGDRPGLGNGDRPAEAWKHPARIGGSEADALAGRGGTFAPDAASRDVARQKIENRKATSSGVATLPAARPAAQGATRKPTVSSASKTRTSASSRSPSTSRSSNVSKPSTKRSPSAGASYKSGSSSAFKSSGGSRASAGASRGRSSSGGRSGGGGGRRR